MIDMHAERAVTALKKYASPDQARQLRRYFKTGPGEYGEGDIFLGIKVPVTRTVAKRFSKLALPDLEKLLSSPVHEVRLMSLLILTEQFARADAKTRKTIARFYLKHAKRINNWDLVDVSAPKILGEYLVDRDRSILEAFARSKNLWKRRIAIVSTYAFIVRRDFRDTINMTDLLINDKHDLIQKACGWMLREVGKRDRATLKRFLDLRAKTMPRTMLRYAIEKLPEEKRRAYLLMRGS
jgi:3-methyladenine DNA glycosylase AlkD